MDNVSRSNPEVVASRVATLIRRHNRFITFAGALIVFGTFVAKELVRDNLKDLADKIGAAQAALVAFTRDRRLHFQLDDLDEQIVKITAAPKPTLLELMNDPSIMERDLPRIIRTVREDISYELDMTYNSLVTLANVSEQLDDEVKGKYEVRQLFIDRDTLDNRSDAIPATSKDIHTLEDSRKLENDVRLLESRVTVQEAVVLREAKALKERDERHLRFASVTSYVLYVFGWGLGLIAKIFSGGGTPNEE